MVSFGPAQSRDKSASDGGDSHVPHPHESPLAMTLPLMLLAVVTIVAGFIPFGHFISSNGEAYSIHLDWSVAGTSIVVAVVAIAIATYIYAGSRQPVANALARRFKGYGQQLTTASTWMKFTSSSPTASSSAASAAPSPGGTATWSTASSTSLPGVPRLPVTRYAVCRADASSNIHLYSCWARWH